jgi:hypothetical protein
MQSSEFSYKDFVDDLKNILISYLKPLNLEFSLFETEESSSVRFSVDEAFMKIGAMPLFLYDKQSFIDEYLSENSELFTEDCEPFASVNFFTNYDNSYFNTKIDIEHNLFVNNHCYEQENNLYDGLLFALAKTILTQKDLLIRNNSVSLTPLYEKFKEFMIPSLEIVNSEVPISLPINFKVRGGK